MKTYVLQALYDRLDTELNKPDVVKKYGSMDYVSLYNDQFNREEDETAIPLPAVLVEFIDIIWQDQKGGIQVGDAEIKFHIGQESLAGINHRNEHLSKSMLVLEYLELIHTILQGFSTVHFTPLSRINDVQDTDHTNVIAHSVIYKTTITDCSADPNLKKNETTLTDINVTGDVVDQLPTTPSPETPYIASTHNC